MVDFVRPDIADERRDRLFRPQIDMEELDVGRVRAQRLAVLGALGEARAEDFGPRRGAALVPRSAPQPLDQVPADESAGPRDQDSFHTLSRQ